MGATYEIPLPKKGIDTYFCASDIHSDHIDLPTFKIMLELAKQYKKKPNLIINGDLLDVDFLFKKNEAFASAKSRPSGIEDYFIPEFDKEIAWGNWFFDSIYKYFFDCIYIKGNHDQRIDYFRESKDCPYAYKDYFSIEKALELEKRNVQVLQYNDWLEIGKLAFTHSQYHGPSAHKKNYDASGGFSVIFGHIHQLEVKSFIVRGNTRQVWSLPCMSTLSPEYIKNGENNWTNGFFVIQVDHNGFFWVIPHQVWNEKLILSDATILDGSSIKLEKMPEV